MVMTRTREAELSPDELQQIYAPDNERHPDVIFHRGLPPDKVVQRKLLDLLGHTMAAVSDRVTNGRDKTLMQRYFYRDGGSPRKLTRPVAVRFAEILDVPVDDLDYPERLALVYAERSGMRPPSPVSAPKVDQQTFEMYDEVERVTTCISADEIVEPVLACLGRRDIRLYATARHVCVLQQVPTDMLEAGDEFVMVDSRARTIFLATASGPGEYEGQQLPGAVSWVVIGRINKGLRHDK